MKLLMDVTNIAPGGGLVVLGNILRQWKLSGVDMDVTAISSRRATTEGLKKYRDDIEILPFMENASPTKVFFGRRYLLGKQIEKLKPDLVFAGNCMVGRCNVPQHVNHQNLRWLLEWPFVSNCRQWGLKRTLRWRKQHSECIKALKNSRSNSFISDYMRQIANKLVPSSQPRNHTVHNASAVNANENYTFVENPAPIIAAIQNTDEYKDSPTLVSVLAKCIELRGDVDWKLRIVGGGNWDSIADLARKLGVINCVEFMNHCDAAKIEGVLDQAYCLIFTSKCEGFGIPPLDAMSRGCAVVSTDVDALPEVVGDAAVLVKPGDVDGFATGVIELYENTEKRRKMVEMGFEQIEKFSWQRSAKKMADILLA